MAIFGMILVAPFFAKSFQNMDQRTAKSLLFLLFIFSGLNLVGVCAGTGFGWPWPLATFFTLFLLGPAINRMHVKSGVALSAFAACTIVSTVLLLNGVQHHPANDNTPFYFIAGISLYLLLKNAAEGMQGHSKAVSILAKYAFSIYMCHLTVMPYVIAFIPPMAKPVTHIIALVTTLLLALGVSVVVDRLLVRPLQHLLDKVSIGKSAEGNCL